MSELSAHPLHAVVEDDGDGGAVVHVHVQPRAGRSELVGRHGDALKIRVTAPPVDGRATEATGRVLANALSVAPSRVVLATGAQSRIKRFRVRGLSAAQVIRRLEAALGPEARGTSEPPLQSGALPGGTRTAPRAPKGRNDL